MIQFKTIRIESEWHQLPLHNRRLADLVQWLADYVHLQYGKGLVLTEIYRTPDETKALYAATPENLRPTWKPHESWMAVDLRSSLYSDQEIHKIVDVANSVLVWGGQRRAAVYHTIRGNVPHFHVQTHDYQKA